MRENTFFPMSVYLQTIKTYLEDLHQLSVNLPDLQIYVNWICRKPRKGQLIQAVGRKPVRSRRRNGSRNGRIKDNACRNLGSTREAQVLSERTFERVSEKSETHSFADSILRGACNPEEYETRNLWTHISSTGVTLNDLTGNTRWSVMWSEFFIRYSYHPQADGNTHYHIQC